MVPSFISLQYFWFNTFIKIKNKAGYYKYFPDNQINYKSDFFDRIVNWNLGQTVYNSTTLKIIYILNGIN